jgi:hypothetical protein
LRRCQSPAIISAALASKPGTKGQVIFIVSHCLIMPMTAEIEKVS